MPFEARLYIQGVGVYVPSAKKPESEMLVLFPNQEKASERGLRDSEGKPICRHYAVVQFDLRCLSSAGLANLPGAWTTVDLSGMRLRFTSDSSLKPRLTVDGRVPGVPSIPTILSPKIPSEDLSLDPSMQPDNSSPTDVLRAGLFLDAGVLSPYAEFEGLYSFQDDARKFGSRPTSDDHKFSSVLKLELGQVTNLTLHFEPFGAATQDPFDLPLHPPSDPDGEPWDELEIWIRHFCDLGRPDLDEKSAEPGERDFDFTLNYMLLKNLDSVLETFGSALPVPRISRSWGRGGLIGSSARKCMAAQA